MKKKPLSPQDILLSLEWAEGDQLEFKSAKGGLPGSLWETYSAMANTQGGVIFLGVEDDGTISGLSDIRKIKKTFWDTINNKSKVSLNLCGPDDLKENNLGGKPILAIRVPQATRYQRPVYVGPNPLTGTFRRNFEGDYRCSEFEIGRMLSDRETEPQDSRIIAGLDLESLDIISVQHFKNLLSAHKPIHPYLGENNQGFLKKIGGWRGERNSRVEGVTYAGLLMFGREDILRQEIPTFHVDYREYLSNDPLLRWSDRIYPDGTWHPNLFQFFIRVSQRLMADLKLPFQLKDSLFRNGGSVVHEALREALVNTLIHADYFGQGGLSVFKRPQSFEFGNPGTLLVSYEQLLHGNISECRNKTLQTMFTLIGAAEKAGSGVDKIFQGWQSQHWRIPRILLKQDPSRVYWFLSMQSLFPEESLGKLETLFGKKFSKCNSNEVQALVTAHLEEFVDNARIRQLCSLHAADVTRLLQSLVARGFLVQKGQARWCRYHLPEQPDSLPNPPDSLHKGVDSLHKGPDSLHKGVDSLHKHPDSLHTEIDKDNNPDLWRIASQARTRKRLLPEETEKLILELCQGRWLTRSQISALLNRNSDSLLNRFLTPMVAHGYLRLRNPDKPNRTDQAYTSNIKSHL